MRRRGVGCEPSVFYVVDYSNYEVIYKVDCGGIRRQWYFHVGLELAVMLTNIREDPSIEKSIEQEEKDREVENLSNKIELQCTLGGEVSPGHAQERPSAETHEGELRKWCSPEQFNTVKEKGSEYLQEQTKNKENQFREVNLATYDQGETQFASNSRNEGEEDHSYGDKGANEQVKPLSKQSSHLLKGEGDGSDNEDNDHEIELVYDEGCETDCVGSYAIDEMDDEAEKQIQEYANAPRKAKSGNIAVLEFLRRNNLNTVVMALSPPRYVSGPLHRRRICGIRFVTCSKSYLQGISVSEDHHAHMFAYDISKSYRLRLANYLVPSSEFKRKGINSRVVHLDIANKHSKNADSYLCVVSYADVLAEISKSSDFGTLATIKDEVFEKIRVENRYLTSLATAIGDQRRFIAVGSTSGRISVYRVINGETLVQLTCVTTCGDRIGGRSH
ncbi:hypothetical protein COOONC_01091 [Cooperia oncophora]